MRCADWARTAGLWLAAALLAGCGGGGNSTETTLIVSGVPSTGTGVEVVADQPQGVNTTEIVVDKGPGGGFSLGVANLPYVTIKVCAPGSTTACATIDHVFLDTGSIGLRLLRSAVAGLGLPGGPADNAAGTVNECYPFVIGAVWGPMAQADVIIAGEQARSLPVQLIDDSPTPQAAAPADCLAAANGGLLKSAAALQANGVLGVGMLRYDCGQVCESGNYANSYTLYYRCTGAGACTPTAVRAEQQVQNPVSQFAVDNNGTLIVMPAVPEIGAGLARGRLVFGIGTQSNNQLPPGATVLHMQTDPASPAYLYLRATTGGVIYDFSYVDSGSNAYFFDDSSLSMHCVGAGAGAVWYCPGSTQARTVVLSDALGASGTVNLSIASADVLFASPNTAFSNLGGASGSANPGAFVLGLPFFYGRTVYTAIWGQALAAAGPWVAF
jgi:hypothetical protein